MNSLIHCLFIIGSKILTLIRWIANLQFLPPKTMTLSLPISFTVVEDGVTKRPDVILFVNGIPLVVLELKNAADENATIDWTIKESVRAKLKVIIKRTLRLYGYPPDMQKLATETVLKQAEMIAKELTAD